jgi:hypothetical protein
MLHQRAWAVESSKKHGELSLLEQQLWRKLARFSPRLELTVAVVPICFFGACRRHSAHSRMGVAERWSRSRKLKVLLSRASAVT